MKRRFIVITGPTASGKTKVSVAVAKALHSAVISADSMQIYKGMDIGTAKASVEEMQGVSHHMIDIVCPDEAYSAAQYQDQAFSLIETMNQKGLVPVIAGGTGLYIHSLTYDIDFSHSPADPQTRYKFTQLTDDKNAECLYNKLKEKDPEYASLISSNDTRRIIRRLEILENGGEIEYNFRRENTQDEFIIIGLNMPRDILYTRINSRVDDMVDSGLVDEAKCVYEKFGDINALKAIGYKELISYFNGSSTLEEAVALIKRNTRRYAKRQMTWFKKDERIKWFDLCVYPNTDDMIDDIIKYISEKGF